MRAVFGKNPHQLSELTKTMSMQSMLSRENSLLIKAIQLCFPPRCRIDIVYTIFHISLDRPALFNKIKLGIVFNKLFAKKFYAQ